MKLEDIIRKASQAYYSNGTSKLTDAEFDNLLNELESQDPDNELLKTGHGYDPGKTSGDKFKHKYGLVGSLPKCRTWDELKSDYKHVDCDVSLKLDGISVVMYYEHGELVRALTRGDGTLGIDITAKVQYIDSTYNHIDLDFTGAIRGEILMSYANFEEFNKLHPEAKNPRNSTAGLIGSKELNTDFKYLSIVVYTIVGYEGFAAIHLESVRKLLTQWFGAEHVVPYMSHLKFTDGHSFISAMNSLQRRWYGKYPADGIVISLDAILRQGDGLIYTAAAFKFPAEAARSKVVAVNWEMSKSCYAIPVVQIKPVDLAGTVVQNASGFHAAYIRDNNIGPGSWIEVSKHGEIIPGIDKIISSTSASLIEVCPKCGQKLEWNGVHLMCKNPECPNAIEQDTLIWLNNICPTDYLGDKLRLKYLHEWLSDNVSIEHLMASSQLNWKILDTSGHDKLFYDMISTLFGTAEIKLVDALLALNIPRLGDITAKKLATECPETLHELVNGDYTYIHEYTISNIVGPATAQAIRENLIKYKRLRFIESRISWKSALPEEVKFSVAITGKLSVSRDEFEKELNNHGYALGELKKGTKYLITNDPNSGSSKNAKADKLGIEKITEAQFRERFF